MIYIQISENFLQKSDSKLHILVWCKLFKICQKLKSRQPFLRAEPDSPKKVISDRLDWQYHLSKQIKKDLLDFNLICLCLNSFLQIKITYLLCKKLFCSIFQWNKNMCSKIFYQWWNMWESTLQKRKLVAKVIKDEEFAKDQAHQVPLIYHHNSY